MYFNKIRSLARQYVQNERGVSHIEFAFCVPAFLALILGSLVVFDYYRVKQKAVFATDALADITARLLQINAVNAAQLFSATDLMMGHYSSMTTVKAKVTGLTFDAQYDVLRPAWSYVHNGASADSVDAEFDPSDYPSLDDGNMIVVAEINFKYKNPFTNTVSLPMEFREIGIRKPRYSRIIPKIIDD